MGAHADPATARRDLSAADAAISFFFSPCWVQLGNPRKSIVFESFIRTNGSMSLCFFCCKLYKRDSAGLHSVLRLHSEGIKEHQLGVHIQIMEN